MKTRKRMQKVKTCQNISNQSTNNSAVQTIGIFFGLPCYARRAWPHATPAMRSFWLRFQHPNLTLSFVSLALIDSTSFASVNIGNCQLPHPEKRASHLGSLQLYTVCLLGKHHQLRIYVRRSTQSIFALGLAITYNPLFGRTPVVLKETTNQFLKWLRVETR